jgi:MoaA/NifB/PqqE/SkfB family radical SAM enzyme
MYSNTFCVLPFIHIATDPDGVTKPCCISSNRSDQNFGQQSTDELFNSEFYRDIRRKMHQGQSVAGCETCYVKEQSSDQSHRTLYNQQYLKNPKIKSLITQSFQQDYQIDSNIYYLDLRFGNLCNLQCRSCNPRNSTQLNKEIIKIASADSEIHEFYATEPQDLNSWYKSQQFQKNIKAVGPDLTTLYITGGEPTIIEQNIQLLETLIAENFAQNITLKISTNLTNISKKLLNLLNQFQTVIVFCSIDGTDQYQEYLRYPSNWQQIKKNFLYLLTHCNKTKFHIKVTPVVQNVNFENIVDLFEFVESYPTVEIWPIVLENPQHFDLQYLPVNYKQQCLDRLIKWYDCYHKKNQFLDAAIKQISYKCHLTTDYQPTLRKFWQVTQMFDQHRSEDLKKVNHRLWQICQTQL